MNAVKRLFGQVGSSLSRYAIPWFSDISAKAELIALPETPAFAEFVMQKANGDITRPRIAVLTGTRLLLTEQLRHDYREPGALVTTEIYLSKLIDVRLRRRRFWEMLLDDVYRSAVVLQLEAGGELELHVRGRQSGEEWLAAIRERLSKA